MNTNGHKEQTKILLTMFLAMWGVFLVTSMTGGALLWLGVIPRTVLGLRGLMFDPRHFLPVTLISMVGSGLMAWLVGAPGSVHIGASGVIFGYLGFLMLAGWWARSFASIALSVVVIALWGGMVVGVMPVAAGVSWQAHLGGLIAGIYAARYYRTTKPVSVFAN
jgi:membrane associated rhomboid family serine protease